MSANNIFSSNSYKASSSNQIPSSSFRLSHPPPHLMNSTGQASLQLQEQLSVHPSQAPTIPDSQLPPDQDCDATSSSRSRGPSPEPRGLDPSDNLRAYIAGAILPPIPTDLQDAIENHMDNLIDETSPQGMSTVTNVRARHTKLAAKPKEGYRVLAEIERIEKEDLFTSVHAYHNSNTRYIPITSTYLAERYPDLVPAEVSNEMEARRAALASFPLKLASPGFVVNTSVEDYETSCSTPKASPVGLPAEDPHTDDESAFRGIKRGITGLGSMSDLQKYLIPSPSQPIRPSQSLPSFNDISPNSSTSSTSTTGYISQLSHILRQTLLPTASSVLSLHEPELKEYSWFGAESGLPGSESVFGGKHGLRGWEGQIWGRPAAEAQVGWNGQRWVNADEVQHGADMKFLLAIQPPWCMPRQNFVDFSQTQEFTDGVRGETSFSGYEKLWATLFDVCIQKNIRYFAITSYEYIAFGCFDQSFKVGYISPPIENKPRAPGIGDKREPSILETLVFWMRSSLGTHENQWAIPDRQAVLVGCSSDVLDLREKLRENQVAQKIDFQEVMMHPFRGVKRTFMVDETPVSVAVDWLDCGESDGDDEGEDEDVHMESEEVFVSQQRVLRSEEPGIAATSSSRARVVHALADVAAEDSDDGNSTERGNRRNLFDMVPEEEDEDEAGSGVLGLASGSGSGSGTFVHPSGYQLRSTPARGCSSTATFRRVSSSTRRTSTSRADSRASRIFAPLPKRIRAKSVAWAVKVEDEEDVLDRELAGEGFEHFGRRSRSSGRDVFLDDEDDMGTPQPVDAAAQVEDVVMEDSEDGVSPHPITYRTRTRLSSRTPQLYPTPPPSRLRPGRLSLSERISLAPQSSPIQSAEPATKKRRLLLVRPDRSVPSAPTASPYNLRQRRK